MLCPQHGRQFIEQQFSAIAKALAGRMLRRPAVSLTTGLGLNEISFTVSRAHQAFFTPGRQSRSYNLSFGEQNVFSGGKEFCFLLCFK